MQPFDADGTARAFLHGIVVVSADALALFFERQFRMPQIDNVMDGSGGDDRTATKLFHFPIITARFDQCPRPRFITIGRLVRQFHGYAEPGAVEIDKRAILVEKNAADLR